MSDAPARLVLDRPADARVAAALLADGTPVAHGFGGIYALTSRGDGVRRVNALKGRPLDQTGSVTAPTGHVLDAFDLSALPVGVPRSLVRDVVDAFSALGPFGFRGPAAGHVPADLTAIDGGTTTTQVIVPGDACPSQTFLAAASDAVGGEPLAISSANRSRHVTGGLDAPVHWRVEGLRAELGGADLVILEHDDDAVARARFPLHTTVSTTILGLHHAERSARAGAPGAGAARVPARHRRRRGAPRPRPRPDDRAAGDETARAPRLRRGARRAAPGVLIVPGRAAHATRPSRQGARMTGPGEPLTVARVDGATDARTTSAVVELFVAYRHFYGRLDTDDDARAFLRRRVATQDSFVWAATTGDAVAGFVQVYPAHSSLGLRTVWWLNDLFVDPSARALGAGRRPGPARPRPGSGARRDRRSGWRRSRPTRPRGRSTSGSASRCRVRRQTVTSSPTGTPSDQPRSGLP